MVVRRQSGLAAEMVLCCRCPSLTFTEDVWWVFVVVVVTFMDAARFLAGDGASRHVAVQASLVCAQPSVREGRAVELSATRVLASA